AVLDLRGQIVERCHIDAAQAKAFARKMENRAPDFFARVGQGRDHESAGTEWADSLRVLIKASAGHGSIVVCEAGKLQTGLVWYPSNSTTQNDMRCQRSPSFLTAFKSIPTCSAFL